MKVSIGSDHGGVDLKTDLIKSVTALGHECIDRGTNSHDSVDYPDFAEAVAQDLTEQEAELGILICTTGIGISISANKIPGIRAAIVHNEDGARFSRMHNDANIICFGAKYQTAYTATLLTEIFLNTAYEGETGSRHSRRLQKITALENEQELS